jgi:hypothetical protein
MAATPDFWPDIADARSKATPLSLMKQQAALLGNHTNNLLVGRVTTITSYDGRLIHHFQIGAPTLSYNYELFIVSHGLVDLYPVQVESAPNLTPGPLVILESERDFLNWLKEVLNSERTKRILSNLLSQVES